LKEYEIIDRKANLKLPYLLTIRKIKKAVEMSAIIAGNLIRKVKTGESMSKENDINDL